MCLGAPGEVIEVHGKTAMVDFWGTRKSVRIDTLSQLVLPGDYIVSHAGVAERRIAPDQVPDILALYEVILCEAGEDPIATDIVNELEAAELLELVTA
ncbi:MAG TPA: HypC/HybG/HupF family hydrogenase formation chaperone [Thermoanaerobaculia bacterium]|jgi:hydrogenase assembly chaperone HypC/HupF|nr:HypC/HybG/HupF family hydrogenase formation chaperone [Thermoanaerobaculia bacterium]